MNRNTGFSLGGLIIAVIVILIALRVLSSVFSLVPLLIIIALVWYFFLGGNRGTRR